MIDELIQLQNLLDKYKVTAPLPHALQEHVLDNKRKQLVIILKKLGRYNPLFGIILFVFFLFRKSGFGLSIIQSAIVLTVSSVFFVGGISFSTYLYVKQSSDSGAKVEHSGIIDKSPSISDNSRILARKQKKTTVAGNLKFEKFIQIHPFESSSEEFSQAITSEIKKELVRLRGKSNILTSGNNSHESSVLMFGSVEKIKISYVITTRLVDKKTGKLIFMTSEQFKSMKDVNMVCKKIAMAISGNIK